MVNRPHGCYEFGPVRLDAAERLLLRDGQAVTVTPKAFDLLLALVDQPGHLLEREFLLKSVWPDTFVEDNNLADNISRLRKILGEAENGQKFIETIPRRGYRFLVEVRKPELANREFGVLEPSAPTPPEAGTEKSADFPFSKSRLIWVALVIAFVGVGVSVGFQVKKSVEMDRLEFKGNFYLSKWNEDAVRKAIEFYTQAVALDPNYASPHEGLAASWNFLSDLHLPPRKAMPRSKAEAIKALLLNEKSSSAHVTMAVIRTQYDWDWPGAETEFKLAVKLDPKNNSARQLYGWYLIAVGRPDQAQAEMKQLLNANPLDDFSLWGLGLNSYFARHYDDAVEQYRRAIGIEPKSHWSHMLLGWAFDQQGRFSDAIDQLDQSRLLFDNNPQVIAAIGHVYARSGQHAAARKVIADLQETAKRRYVSPYDVATIYAGLGDKEQTLVWLERAYEDRCGWLAWWLKVDPKFDLLRSHPSFQNLLRRIGHSP
ncbi:MAG: winged helix-turn-helix domain-containing protein [Bryobacteraceae bacterium]